MYTLNIQTLRQVSGGRGSLPSAVAVPDNNPSSFPSVDLLKRTCFGRGRVHCCYDPAKGEKCRAVIIDSDADL